MDSAVNSVLTGIVLKKTIKETTVVDQLTVRIDLLTPVAALATSFLAGQSFQRSPTSLATPDGGSAHPVGTGPFKFDNWKRDDRFVVDRNPAYWRPNEPYLDGIEFRIIADDTARASALQAGDLDMMFTVAAKDAAFLDEGYTVVRDWDTEQSMLIANTRPKVGDHINPMANVHARRAVALATDRRYVADLLGQGLQLFSGPFSPDSPWGQPESQSEYPGYDPDAARKEVALYKEETGRDIDIRILGVADTTSAGVLQALQSQWSEVGITASIKTVDGTAFLQGLIASVYDVAFTTIYSSPDPEGNYPFWQRANIGDYGTLSINMSGFANDTTERLMLESRATADVAKRHDLTNQLVREFNRNLTSIWLYATPFSLVAADRVHGLQPAADIPMANFQPKPWWGQVWLAR
jgi:ABC-type transport system substrate-binding protein